MKKIKIGLLVLALGMVIPALAQEGGIRFERGNWADIKEKAIREKKLIFVDFYTDWCGPCLAMAEEVFPLAEVGEYYNKHFVNVKIDAEKGEGLALRKKYEVASFPTFVFIDPQTEKVVHRSSSRQEKEVFLFTGKSAVHPAWRSTVLEQKYRSGERSRELLKQYMDYLASVYKRDEVKRLVEEYLSFPDFSLHHPMDWEVFVKHIRGTAHACFRELMGKKEEYTALYGKEAVENKLFDEFSASMDVENLQQAPDFKGKEFLLLKNQAEKHIRNKEYAAAIPLLEKLMIAPGDFNRELCHYLKFVSRSVLYGEHPDFWLRKCAELAQYVAYNHPDRQDAGIHYDYALILEKLIRNVPEAEKYFPPSVTEQPAYGNQDYSLRPAKLKPKPRKK